MPPTHYITPAFTSTSTFKDNIFNGKVLFCTGGGSGIGKAMTEAIMRHGANAVIVGRNLQRLEKAAEDLSKATGRTCLAAPADVRKPQELKTAVANTIAKFGKIDFVICAAAGNFLAPISGMSENAFKSVIEIDVLGTFNTIKATLPQLRNSHGSYLHISTTIGYTGTPYQVHVSAAKSAIDSLSNVLAVEEGPWGVRSNVLTPGPIAGTEGMDRLVPKNPDGSKNLDSWRIPLGRMGTLEECGSAGVFLFSDAASLFTGATIVMDGGSMHFQSGPVLPYPASSLESKRIIETMVNTKL